MTRILLLALMLALTACAHMSQEQCIATNWHSEGFQDGSIGTVPRDLNKPIQDCSQYGVKVNTLDYQAGWKAGAKQYCVPDVNVGIADGQAGKSATDIQSRQPTCTLAGVPLSLNAYNVGRQKGLKTFCTADNGALLAQEGKSLPAGVCGTNSKITAGWTTGKNQFCQQNINAFALGKQTKPYPDMCPPDQYIAFKSEYDRGFAIGQRINDLQSRIDAINEQIKFETQSYALVPKDGSDFYELSWAKSDEAVKHLQMTNDMVRRKQPLEAEKLSLQIMN